MGKLRYGEAVVLFSGGMDSVVLAAHLRARGLGIRGLCVNYGQAHVREVEAAESCADWLGMSLEVLQLKGMQRQLVRELQVPADGSDTEPVFSPARNLVLLALATSYAVANDCGVVGFAAHARPGGGDPFPDSRVDFIRAVEGALGLCHYEPVRLEAPFAAGDKGDICIRGLELRVPYARTWTCYGAGPLACGTCGACRERLAAFAKAGVADPVAYAGQGGV